jgi:hypothetical protein
MDQPRQVALLKAVRLTVLFIQSHLEFLSGEG